MEDCRRRIKSPFSFLFFAWSSSIFELIAYSINYERTFQISPRRSIPFISPLLASYPELLVYFHHPDAINRNALLAHGYEQFYARVAPFSTPLLSMLLLCSTYFTVLVSGDRYFLICWPSIAEKIRTRKIALILVLLVFVLVNLYIFPHWFEYRTESRSIKKHLPWLHNASNVTVDVEVVELSYTSLGLNTIYQSIYRFYLNVPITFVIPFTLLTLCNGSMIHQLLLIKKKKKRFGHRMRADIRITMMLIVIVLTFMLCRSINLFVNLLVQLSPCLNKNSLQRFNAFANLFIAFNGFVNFFLFAAFGQRFREMVLYIFFRHGQYPFSSVLDGNGIHRFSSARFDTLRRQSRNLSMAESELWAAISRRRSSATMAGLYSPPDSREKSSTSRLNIPPANVSTELIETPLLDSSETHFPPVVPMINGRKNSLPTTHRVSFA